MSTADQLPQDAPFPPASLTILISTLATQAMVALGNIPNPATKAIEKHLGMAKHLIDTIDVLEQKTRGNCNEQESHLLERALHELRLAYVNQSKGG